MVGCAANMTSRLYDFSIAEVEKFWRSVWTFAGVIADRQGDRVLRDGDKMPGAAFFPESACIPPQSNY